MSENLGGGGEKFFTIDENKNHFLLLPHIQENPHFLFSFLLKDELET
jgi:hypothetical protein